MTYCPQGYNQAWSGKGEELEAMKKLDKDINIYWTGADVNAPITQETVDFLKTKTNHNPDYWLIIQLMSTQVLEFSLEILLIMLGTM